MLYQKYEWGTDPGKSSTLLSTLHHLELPEI
jgi:hypothetical protein